jgi:hypothetical protein
LAGLARIRSWISAAFGCIAVHFLTAAPVSAQCILCYTSVAGSGDRGIRTLQIGILILLVPTVAMLSGLVWMAVRRRNSDAGADAYEMDPGWEEGLAGFRAASETSGPNTLSPRS